MVFPVIRGAMSFSYLTFLIFISTSNSIIDCRTVTYNNVNLVATKIANNRTRKVEDKISNPDAKPSQASLWGKKYQNKYLKRFPVLKKSLYTVAVFNDDQNQTPSHTLAIFKSPQSTSKPSSVDQFILPQLDEDTREGEVFPNNVEFDHWSNADDDSYKVDQSLNQAYFTIPENDVQSAPGNYSFSNSFAVVSDNFTGYPDSRTTTTERPFDGYSYQAPGYLPPGQSFDLVSNESGDFGNATEVVKVAGHDLFAHYYIGYKLWYLPILFAIYHAIMVIFFLLTILAKHYTKFPAALQAAAATE